MKNELAESDHTSTVYCLSMNWFKQWESFVCKDNAGKKFPPLFPEQLDSTACFADEPGPIDNSRIGVLRGGVMTVRMSADACHLSHDMWRFLVDTYGGGPEVFAREKPT